MTPSKTIIVFIDHLAHWPTVLRGDLLARYHRLKGQAVDHWIIASSGGFYASDPARLDLQSATVARLADYTDGANVMADRLLAQGAAYEASGSIFLPWRGEPTTPPPPKAAGRRNPNDIHLWGPRIPDGPSGPSGTLTRIAMLQEHANGCADWMFSDDTQEIEQLHVIARAAHGGPACKVMLPPLGASRAIDWTGATSRWAALQCTAVLTYAQSQQGARAAQAVRRVNVSADHAPQRAHLRMIKQAEAALMDCDWRDANRLLLSLCATVIRMQAGEPGRPVAPSRQMRTRLIALLDALGL